MATELGVAYLSIVPETSKLAPGIKQALGDTSASGRAADNAGKSIGARLSGTLTKTLKVGALTAGGAVVGTLGTALYKGFSRLQGIEQAQAKLTGLGHSAKSVEKIMGNALGAVKGTAFGLDQAATVAASAVAAGVKPGKDLQRTLTLVGDAATIAGTDMGSMGAIFNKVAASNKIQGDVINQLNDAGIPIVQLLGKELGTTAEETLKLASEGKVNFATFQKAMQKGLGGAAQESGKTVAGSFANMQAALGRLGATLLGGVFDKLPNLLQGVTGKLDKFGPVAERAGKFLGGAMAEGIKAFRSLVKAIGPVVEALQSKLEPVARKVFDFFRKNPAVIKGAAIALGVLAGALGAVALGMAAVSLAASPIALIVLGVAALGAGIAYLWKNNEGFRSFVIQLGEVLNKVGVYIRDNVIPAMVDLAQKVATNLQPVWLALVDFFHNSLIPAAQQLLAKFREWSPTIQRIVGFVGSMVAKWAEFYSTVASKVLPIVIKIAGFLVKQLVGAFIRNIEVTGQIIGKLIGFGKAVFNAGKAVVDFAKKVGTKIGNVLTWIGELPRKALSALGDVGTLLVDVGKQIIGGLWNGIKAKWDEVKGKVADIGHGVAGAIKGALKIKSPSRVMMQIGGFIMSGLRNGLRAGLGELDKTLDKISSKVATFLDKKKVGKKVARQANKVLSQVTNAAAALSDVIAKHADTVSSIASNLAGEFSLSDIFADSKNEFGLSTGGSPTSIASGIANRMRAFAEKLTALVGSGLPSALISEIAGYGSVEGSRIADQFLKMSQADQASIRSSYDVFSGATQSAGLAVATATYGSDLARAEQTFATAIENGLSKLGIHVTVGVDKETSVKIVDQGNKHKNKRK